MSLLSRKTWAEAPGPNAGLGTLLPLAAGLAGLAFMISVLNVGFQIGDEGIALVDAWRVALGQVPYRDFFEFITPLSFAVTALVFKLFGVGLLQGRLLALAYGLLLLVLADRLLIRYAKDALSRALLIAFLVPFGVFYWPMPSHHWVTDLMQMGAALALLRGLDERPLGWGLLAGALTAGAALSLQDQGVAFAVAATVLVFPGIEDSRTRRRLFTGWIAAGAIVSAVFLAWLAAAGALGEFWRQTVLFPLQRYKALPGNRGGLTAGWESAASFLTRASLRSAPVFSLSVVASAAVLWALPLLSLGALGVAYRKRWRGRPALGVLAALVLAFLVTCARRWTLTNLVWAAPPLAVACAWGLARWRERARRLAACAAWSLIALFAIFSAAYVQRSHAQGTILKGAAGSLRGLDAVETRTAQETVNAIEANVPPGAPLFCRGYLPLFNFLTLRPNPTRFTVFIYPDSNTEPQFEEVKRTLSGRDAWVLTPLPMKGDAFDWWLLQSHTPVWKTSYAALFAPSPHAPPDPATGAGPR